ncbi:hypothetical protein RCL1_001052 [Eukaryota sp. TZLM3-RCL]
MSTLIQYTRDDFLRLQVSENLQDFSHLKALFHIRPNKPVTPRGDRGGFANKRGGRPPFNNNNRKLSNASSIDHEEVDEVPSWDDPSQDGSISQFKSATFEKERLAHHSGHTSPKKTAKNPAQATPSRSKPRATSPLSPKAPEPVLPPLPIAEFVIEPTNSVPASPIQKPVSPFTTDPELASLSASFVPLSFGNSSTVNPTITIDNAPLPLSRRSSCVTTCCVNEQGVKVRAKRRILYDDSSSSEDEAQPSTGISVTPLSPPRSDVSSPVKSDPIPSPKVVEPSVFQLAGLVSSSGQELEIDFEVSEDEATPLPCSVSSAPLDISLSQFKIDGSIKSDSSMMFSSPLVISN